MPWDTVFPGRISSYDFAFHHFANPSFSSLMLMKSLPLVLTLLFASNCAAAEKIVLVAGGGTSVSGPAKEAKLNAPFGIDFDEGGNAFLVELTGGRLLKINREGMLTPLGGTEEKGNEGDGGPARNASFNGMHSLAIGPDGLVYLADTWNNRIRTYDPKGGKVNAFAGTGEK